MNQFHCLKKANVFHGSVDVAARCCYREAHKFTPQTYKRAGYLREVGTCTHAYLVPSGYGSSRQISCGAIGDVPWHVRKPLGAYKPHKHGAAQSWKPIAWTGPVPQDLMARYCDDGALAAVLCAKIAASTPSPALRKKVA